VSDLSPPVTTDAPRPAWPSTPLGAPWSSAFRWFLRLVVWSSVWVAGAVASLSLFAQAALGLELSWAPIALVFVSALFIYNLDHVIDARVQQIDDAEARRYFRSGGVRAFTALAGVGMALGVALAPPAAWPVFATYALVGVLYGVPLIPAAGGRRAWRLKDVPFSKGLLVGFSVAVGTVGMPLAYAGRGLSEAAVFVAVFVFVFVSSNTHVCDIPDVPSDRRAGVRTLPASLGVRHTKRALVSVNLLLLAAMSWGWGRGLTGLHVEMMLSLCASVVYILAVHARTRREVFGVLVDGAAFLPALLHAAGHAR